ncbi:MAG: hypothetical protein HC866_08340 [Leptolyngbyaceae cyanobacterium RU_5_1]|nr:hypothetical protein [Leptolyngbyaceae cyanobacterium RU_5_1]
MVIGRKRFHGLGRSLTIAAALLLMLGTAEMGSFSLLANQPAIAQSIRSEGVWRQVYEKLPNLPLENQYVNKETKKVATGDTLVGRLIRYHLYVKGRPPFYRLDWKLTMAEYLGLFGLIDEADYPSRTKLNKNPQNGDIAAIQRLSRAQRDALIQALVDAFTPQSARSPKPVPKPVIQLPGKGRF